MGPAIESDKLMFEIYREVTFTGQHRVVYFTELGEHNKEKEINDATSGEHIFDGYLRNHTKEQAKLAVVKILERLDAGEALSQSDIERELKPYMA